MNQLLKLNDDFTDNSTNNHQGTRKFMNGIESSLQEVAQAKRKPPDEPAQLKKMFKGSKIYSVEAP